MLLPRKMFLLLLCPLLFVLGCGNNKPSPVTNERDSMSLPSPTGKMQDSSHAKYNHLISNIPIPFDILRRLSTSYVLYKAELLHPVTALAAVNQTDSKSLCLGVYGADLTYIISLGEFKEFPGHIKIIKRLADDLGVPTAFDDNMMTRYNINETNKDTLQNVMYHSYTEIDKTLKSNDRLGMAALVVCGGWIESLYLTTQTIGINEDNGSYTELYTLVSDQKKHLENLISLLNDFKTAPFSDILIALQKIDHLYKTAADKNHLNWTEVQKISAEVKELRTKITQRS
jgi:hypothetical protein